MEMDLRRMNSRVLGRGGQKYAEAEDVWEKSDKNWKEEGLNLFQYFPQFMFRLV